MSKKTKIAFIINPVAGAGIGSRVLKDVKDTFDKLQGFKVKTEITEYNVHASELTEKFKAKNYNIVVAVGGDGTVNEVAKQLVGSEAKLGIIPIGSGNGLARHLGIPIDVKKAIKVILEENVKHMDTGLINNQYFFCTCGVGFDARIGSVFAEQDQRGFRTYVKTTIQEFSQYKPEKYKLSIDGEKVSEKAFLITCANASQYGNNAFIAPLASTTDGLIDVSILRPFPLFHVLGLGLKLFTKRIHRSRFMKIYRGREVSIKRKGVGEVHIDGEPFQMGKKLKISILPAKLHVIVP